MHTILITAWTGTDSALKDAVYRSSINICVVFIYALYASHY